jgi:hypothetical protein
MSSYPYYEFRSIDRLLSRDEKSSGTEAQDEPTTEIAETVGPLSLIRLPQR